MRTLSPTARQQIHAQQTQATLITLLTVRLGPADARRTLLFTDAPAGLRSRGKNYTFLPFRLETPSNSTEGTSNASIKINVSDEISGPLRESHLVDVDIEVVLSSNHNRVEARWANITLEQIQWDAGIISAELGFPSFDKEPYPGPRFLPGTTPGAF